MMRRGRGQEMGGRGQQTIRVLLLWFTVYYFFVEFPCPTPLAPCLMIAEAAVSKGTKQQLETASTNQGGGTVTSTKFRQQMTFGEAVAGTRISSARFGIIPGFIGASLSAPTAAAPVSDLDITVLYARTDPLGLKIPAQTWQKVKDPTFIWESPATGSEVAGYSYALDGTPDNTLDTTSTSFNVATSPQKILSDGKHTFSVKALNSAGNAGKPISFELWVDTTPPQITTYTPSPGTLLNTLQPTVNATLSDTGSGVNQSTLTLLVNGSPAAVQLNPATGLMSGTGGAWKEGANSLELRVSDTIGNAQAPLVWSVTVDTTPPVGTITINGGAAMTTSVYVTLGLNASDAISGVTRMLLSNDAVSGYVEEPYVAKRELWKLNPIRGKQKVYVKFMDKAGNTSAPVSAEIDVGLLAPDTIITNGPAGFVQDRTAFFAFKCPEGDCVFSYAFDNEPWSEWGSAATATKADLPFGNHYFRVKAAKEVNSIPGIQPDEEDPSPAERTWIVGVEQPLFSVPKGPAIKVWRLE